MNTSEILEFLFHFLSKLSLYKKRTDNCRLGIEKAKRMLLTGDKITGVEAEKLGLVLKSVPREQLDGEVEKRKGGKKQITACEMNHFFAPLYSLISS